MDPEEEDDLLEEEVLCDFLGSVHLWLERYKFCWLLLTKTKKRKEEEEEEERR
jgi:hypothetical protein